MSIIEVKNKLIVNDYKWDGNKDRRVVEWVEIKRRLVDWIEGKVRLGEKVK